MQLREEDIDAKRFYANYSAKAVVGNLIDQCQQVGCYSSAIVVQGQNAEVDIISKVKDATSIR